MRPRLSFRAAQPPKGALNPDVARIAYRMLTTARVDRAPELVSLLDSLRAQHSVQTRTLPSRAYYRRSESTLPDRKQSVRQRHQLTLSTKDRKPTLLSTQMEVGCMVPPSHAQH